MSARRKSVLVVSPEDGLRERLGAALRREWRVLRAGSAEAGLSQMEHDEVDLVLTAADLPGLTGLELLRILRENYPLTESIVVGSRSDVEAAVEAIKIGAYHYLPDDVAAQELRATAAHAAERQELNRRVLSLRAEMEEGEREFVAGPSRAMADVLDVVRKVAPLSATVLLLGESGTGKELLARLIHRESAAADGLVDRPFIAVNLAAIPRELVESTLFGHERGAFTGAVQQRIGKFELASGGTLFLDEIGDLRLDLQAKLLRALQEGEIERVGGGKPIHTAFRLIAATNVDLDLAVKDGSFREDLFYRLNVIPVQLPPLRERLEDLPVLADVFLRRYNARFRKQVKGIAESTLDILRHYWWPGNIRELENLIERLVATTSHEWITDEDLPFEFHVAELDRARTDQGLLDRAVQAFERNFLIRALERSGWNVTRTARYLGVPLSTLKFKMDRLEIRALAKRVRGR
ncbi:MAG: sigma-54-dependent transcriptional regulator [Vicinamibacterales bacterium]